MDKSELWDELKEYLVKAIPPIYDLAFKARYDNNNKYEEFRLTAKASGMDLVLQKMEEYECSLLD